LPLMSTSRTNRVVPPASRTIWLMPLRTKVMKYGTCARTSRSRTVTVRPTGKSQYFDTGFMGRPGIERSSGICNMRLWAVPYYAKYMPRPDIVLGHNPLQYITARRVWNEDGLWCYCSHSPAVEEMRIVWQNQGILGRFKHTFGIAAIQRMEAEILQFSDALVVESDYTRKLLKARYGGANTDRIEVIPGWVDLTRFQVPKESTAEARQQLGWPIDRPVLFSLRRLEPRMGLDSLLHAYKLLVDAGHRFHTVIGGTGSQQSALLALRDRLGLEASVTFMGKVPDSLLPLAYYACDASVVPSAQLECFGLIALESIACGTPTLVTPIGALPSVVSQFHKEWIAPSANPEGIATLLQRFLDGALPPMDNKLTEDRMAYYSLPRALSQYRKCLKLPDTPVL